MMVSVTNSRSTVAVTYILCLFTKGQRGGSKYLMEFYIYQTQDFTDHLDQVTNLYYELPHAAAARVDVAVQNKKGIVESSK